MGAGGRRELGRKGTRVAAPPCFRRRRRSAPLLFESTLVSPLSRLIKQKLRYPSDTGVLGGRGWIARAALYKEPRSRLPAAASCLGRHAHPAGRSPNSSSLFLPQAAVVAVAQGLFSPPDCSAGRCCSNPPAFVSLTHKQNKKLQRTKYARAFLVGAGGFEPPKLKAADLQSVPIGHSGTRPYSFVVHPCTGRLIYFSMRKGFCQPPFFTFFGNIKRTGSFRFRFPLSIYAKGAAAQNLVQQPLFLWISYFSTAPRFALVTMRA